MLRRDLITTLEILGVVTTMNKRSQPQQLKKQPATATYVDVQALVAVATTMKMKNRSKEDRRVQNEMAY